MRTLLLLTLLLAVPTLANRSVSPAIHVALLEARTHPDTHWFGEKAYLFRVAGITAEGLDGKKVTWTLSVKRKLAAWGTAKVWIMSKQNASSPEVAYALIYRNMAKAKMLPGEHTARMTATDEAGREVYRGEVAFVIPAAGPNAYRPSDFR